MAFVIRNEGRKSVSVTVHGGKRALRPGQRLNLTGEPANWKTLKRAGCVHLNAPPEPEVNEGE